MYCPYARKDTSCITFCTQDQVKNKAIVSCANFGGRLLPVDSTTLALGSHRVNKENSQQSGTTGWEILVNELNTHSSSAIQLIRASSNNNHFSGFSAVMSYAPSALLTLPSPLYYAVTYSTTQPPNLETANNAHSNIETYETIDPLKRTKLICLPPSHT
ncbi:hypothetical protein COCSADRAFT_26682 [Bipolaris sorokiniana ND90Pr]|uniref:Uncharacterized protein n=1 Tax=Cochliobolus sativus (strain ND90Pr / ATCC 201652) TaxID=665912 RepID=M2RCL1_COCSN|nr:uncharacterized protein COCSADRAFT_26682 [Bipolaris sorokiniana ND90Pr]EMD64544.1 hypothetical protein COCSADRAFT_26682 [Bipolaris sorokiniana ND90Pr]